MTMHLTLVPGEARAVPAFTPPPIALDQLTQRPGELADLVVVELEPLLRERLATLAATERLPLPLFAVIAVEAARALDEVAELLDISADDLASLVDDAATAAQESDFEPRPTRALRAYAKALSSGAFHGRGDGNGTLTLVVPDRLRARWSLTAQDEGQSLDAWIGARLATAQAGRGRWEARAAYEGRTLAEWLSLQALKR
jgi:predicted HicB family RNase H-like nuclease